VKATQINWINPAPITLTVLAPLRTVTATVNGDWSNPATWGGSTPPGPNDVAVINSNVTISAGEAITVGDGSARTVLDVTNGTLTITGGTLTIRGNATFGKYANSITTTRLVVQSTGTQPAGIELDGNAGVSPVISVADDTLISFLGTATARCFLRTRLGTAGNAGAVLGSGTLHCFFFTASYTDFARLGDATHPGLQSLSANRSDNLANPPFTMDHCTVDSSGTFPNFGSNLGSLNFQLTNCSWTNPAGATALSLSLVNPIAGGGTRLVDRNSFYGLVNIQTVTGVAFTNNYFNDYFQGNKSQPQWAAFDSNFCRKTSNTFQPFTNGNVTNSYFFCDPPGGV
jgi:hypothetical protein